MEFSSAALAFEAARTRSSVAAALEAEVFDKVVGAARQAGMSIRQAAAAIGVPKSTIARHWNNDHHCPRVLPVSGSEGAWRDAHADIWAHDPEELAKARIPDSWQMNKPDAVVPGSPAS